MTSVLKKVLIRSNAMNYMDMDKKRLSDFPDYDGHELVRRIEDPESGMVAFIAVHNSALGPALGGCRIWPYASENDAIHDVLRLSKGMTYKNALAGLPLGGGKSVIIADPYKDKTEAMVRAMARAVDDLQGLYITAEDSGLTEEDVVMMYEETPYVTGFSDANDAESVGGNPSPVTSYGVYHAMKASVKKLYGSASLRGKSVSVQGLGAVGMGLCALLDKEGVSLHLTDVRVTVLEEAKARFQNVTIVEPDAIFDADVDIFAPCAMGAQLNEDTIPRLRVDLVVGAANNQLATDVCGQMLSDRKILYAPDFVVNSGGVTAVAYEYFQRSGVNPFDHDLTRETMMAHVEKAAGNIEAVFEIAEKENLLPGQAANALAERIFKQGKDTSNGSSPLSRSNVA